MSLRLDKLKEEIKVSRALGTVKVKSNCPYCYETGVYGVDSRTGKPVLCGCLSWNPGLLEQQNKGELQEVAN